MTGTTALRTCRSGRRFRAHYETVKDLHLRALFASDAGRAERFAVEAAGLFLDYSKNRITDETVRLLVGLARARGVEARRDAMFSGEKINVSENRAVLHVALRAPRDQHILVDGEDVAPEVHSVLDRMAAFSEQVRSGAWTGHSGKRIRNVVNIGIGGSYLGPEMAYRALRQFRRSRASTSASSPMSTAPTSPRRRTTSTRTRPCSSSRPRPSPRWRR